jgi:hypothetical protein
LMARRPPERLAEALRANLRRRKASAPVEEPEKAAAAPVRPAPKDPQPLKDKAKIPPRPKG